MRTYTEDQWEIQDDNGMLHVGKEHLILFIWDSMTMDLLEFADKHENKPPYNMTRDQLANAKAQYSLTDFSPRLKLVQVKLIYK